MEVDPMRKFLFAGAAVSLILGLLTIPWGESDAQTAPDYRFGTRTQFSWDAVTKDVLGNVVIVPFYEIGTFDVAADLSAGKDPAPLVPAYTVTSANLTTPAATNVMAPLVFQAVPRGTRCKVAVRAMDGGGNRSDWSDSLTGKWDDTKPGKPVGPGCKLLQ